MSKEEINKVVSETIEELNQYIEEDTNAKKS